MQKVREKFWFKNGLETEKYSNLLINLNTVLLSNASIILLDIKSILKDSQSYL